ncbi:hypothetical protein LTR10_009675 [Elasticomyces elasticus]|nr:hypothetical protein LTR10_009675 [Elasticomyces elasticus]KAK4969966.1 hypothetical protein LTR42_008133 [Elasticomyces elasticus]
MPAGITKSVKKIPYSTDMSPENVQSLLGAIAEMDRHNPPKLHERATAPVENTNDTMPAEPFMVDNTIDDQHPEQAKAAAASAEIGQEASPIDLTTDDESDLAEVPRLRTWITRANPRGKPDADFDEYYDVTPEREFSTRETAEYAMIKSIATFSSNVRRECYATLSNINEDFDRRLAAGDATHEAECAEISMWCFRTPETRFTKPFDEPMEMDSWRRYDALRNSASIQRMKMVHRYGAKVTRVREILEVYVEALKEKRSSVFYAAQAEQAIVRDMYTKKTNTVRGALQTHIVELQNWVSNPVVDFFDEVLGWEL